MPCCVALTLPHTPAAAGFINVALIGFACLTIKTRLPPRPAGKFVDFKVFVGKPNLGFTLYVAGAATVWLGTCPSSRSPSLETVTR